MATKAKTKASKFEAVMQQLEQAKTSGNTKHIKFWTDILLALEKASKPK